MDIVASPKPENHQKWISYLFHPRARFAPPSNPIGPVELLVLALYAALAAWGIWHHVNWADEAQSWLIASNSTLHDLLFRRLHYEGAPALWPLLLFVLSRLHVPYTGINWVGGSFALAGIFIWLRFSPFPRIFRWLIPFSFFLQYQFAVIARPYVFFPLLLFALCVVVSRERPRPLAFAVIAGLMTNISIHAAVIAGIFALLYLQRLLSLRSALPVAVSGKKILASAALFSVFAFASAAVAFPPPDSAFVVDGATSTGPVHAVLLKVLSEERLPATAPPLDPPIRIPDAPVTPQGWSRLLLFSVKTLILGANSLTYPIARSNLLALMFLGLLIVFLWSRRCLRLTLPFVASILFSVQVWVYDHHTGMFLLALVAALWIAFSTSAQSRGPRWTSPAFSAAGLLVLLLQIGWTVHTLHVETYAPYDPGRETAEFLISHYTGKRIAGFSYENVSTQAYAPRNLFYNQQVPYWVWSNKVLIDRRRTEALAGHPDVIVTGVFINQPEVIFNQWTPILSTTRNTYSGMLRFWEDHGYRVTHIFCGNHWTRMGSANTTCEDILEPAPAPVPATSSPVRPAVPPTPARPAHAPQP